eukprot:scaffold13637_cov112-Isochrysis_galbana.AAC.6
MARCHRSGMGNETMVAAAPRLKQLEPARRGGGKPGHSELRLDHGKEPFRIVLGAQRVVLGTVRKIAPFPGRNLHVSREVVIEALVHRADDVIAVSVARQDELLMAEQLIPQRAMRQT